jgi:protein-S-isoprenylcysteine O-methyltransferase Ste14
MKPRAPTDLRKMQQEANRRLFALVIIVLVFVGAGLIALSYGAGPAVVALACLLFGAGLLGILWLVFSLIGKWADAE